MATYLTDNDGKFIPATQRPDGTWRKARRVKQGYVPQEEVPLYESKGKFFANKASKYPVGMRPVQTEIKKEKPKKTIINNIPGVIVMPKKNNLNHVTEIQSINKLSENLTKENSIIEEEISNELNDLIVDEKQELLKKIRKLKKKIREIEAIEEKIKSKELKKPEKDQLNKIKRKKEILKEIDDLEKLIL